MIYIMFVAHAGSEPFLSCFRCQIQNPRLRSEGRFLRCFGLVRAVDIGCAGQHQTLDLCQRHCFDQPLCAENVDVPEGSITLVARDLARNYRGQMHELIDVVQMFGHGFDAVGKREWANVDVFAMGKTGIALQRNDRKTAAL